MSLNQKTPEELGCRRRDGVEYVKCPNCSEDRKKKGLKTLGVKHDENYAFCNHCQASFTLTGEKIYQEKEVRTYLKPPPMTNKTNLSDKMVEWFNGRGISQGTLMEMKVGEGMEWMPQVKKERNTVQFNYFIDDELITIKYRDGNKNFKLFKDAKLVFYNLNSLKTETSAIICEGEIDALSWHEAGYHNVISVPNGAQLSDKEREEFLRTGKFSGQSTVNLSYIDNSFDQINHIDTWYIATDTDAAGMKLRHELLRRLGAENCWIINFDTGAGALKDANDLLVKEGPLALDQAFKSAKQVPIQGVFELNDCWQDIEYAYDNGYDKGKTTGLEVLDPHFKWRLGELTIVNGIPNHGKSSVFLYLAIMASIQYGWKWAIYSPETNPVSYLWTLLIEIYMGKSSDREKSFRMSKEELRMGADWVHEHFFVVDSDETLSYSELNDKFKLLVKRKGINAVFVDPWNDLKTDKKGGETTEDYLQRALSDIRRFKRSHNVHYAIAAHPVVIRDRDQTGKPIVPTSYHLSGGAMWANRADNIITVYRDFDAEIFGESQFHVQKIKFQKLVGIPTNKDQPALIYFDSHSQRFDDAPRPEALEAAANKKEESHIEAVKEAAEYAKGAIFDEEKLYDDPELDTNDELPF